MTRTPSRPRSIPVAAGGRNALAGQVMLNLAFQIAIPMLRETPHWLGTLRARSQWQVHLYGLCRANPGESFCCVSRTPQPGSSPGAGAAGGCSLSTAADLETFVVPMRFHPDHSTSLSFRPSSCSTAVPFREHWSAQADGLGLDPAAPGDESGALIFRRQADGLEFIATRSAAVAQVTIAELVRTMPLWRGLAQAHPSLRKMVLEALS